jgi:hypothetical protein
MLRNFLTLFLGGMWANAKIALKCAMCQVTSRIILKLGLGVPLNSSQRSEFCCAGCWCLWQTRIAGHGLAFRKVRTARCGLPLRRLRCPIFPSGLPGPPSPSPQPLFLWPIRGPIKSHKNCLRIIKVRFIAPRVCVPLSHLPA